MISLRDMFRMKDEIDANVQKIFGLITLLRAFKKFDIDNKKEYDRIYRTYIQTKWNFRVLATEMERIVINAKEIEEEDENEGENQKEIGKKVFGKEEVSKKETS